MLNLNVLPSTLTPHMGKRMLRNCSISNQRFSNKRATGELFCFEAMDANIGERGIARGVRVRGGDREEDKEEEEQDQEGLYSNL